MNWLHRYLAGTVDWGCSFEPDPHNDDLVRAHYYSDADFLGDKVRRRSTNRFAAMAFGGATSWTSKAQTRTAKSTAESELAALCYAAAETRTFNQFWEEIAHPECIPAYLSCNNQVAIAFANSHPCTTMIKYFKRDYFFVKDKVDLGKLTVHSIPSADNVADLFTKPLKLPLFQKHINTLNIHAP